MNRWISNWWKWTIGKLTETRGDVGQMFTPPKSKSPWEAMTSGSTGGWASFAGPSQTTNPNDPAGWGWVGPALTTAMGAIPGVGPFLSAGMGAMGAMGGRTGFQGTDYGWGNVGSTLLGAGLGYGAGALGKGISTGIGNVMSGPGVSASGHMLGGTAGQVVAGGGTAVSGAPLNLFSTGFGTGVSQALQPFGGMLGGGMLGGGGAGGTAAGGTAAGGAAAGGSSLLSNPLVLMGLGGAALSSMRTAPEPPQMGSTIAKWLTSDAITRAGKLAQSIQETEYMGEFDLDKETQAYIQVMGKDIEKGYKDRVTQLDRNMGAMNPHWKFSGERLEMVRRINEESQREQDMMKSQWVFHAKQQYAQNKYNTVMSSMQVDDVTKQALLFGEISDVMWRYNVERDDLLDFRQVARDAGMYLMQKGAQGMLGY